MLATKTVAEEPVGGGPTCFARLSFIKGSATSYKIEKREKSKIRHCEYCQKQQQQSEKYRPLVLQYKMIYIYT